MFAAGIYLGSMMDFSLWLWAIAALAGLIWGLRHEGLLLLALFALGGWLAPPHPDIEHQVPINSRLPVAFTAVVEEIAQSPNSIDHLLRPLPGELPRFNISKLLWRAAPTAYDDSVTLPRYGIGDTLELLARLRRPHERRNPNGFRESVYLWTRQIDARTTGAVYVRQWKPADQISWARTFDQLRQMINSRLEDWVGPRAGLGRALLLGDRSGLDWEFTARVRAIGVAHVLAVSGLHAGFIAIFIVTLLRLSMVPQLARLLITAVILAAYAAVAGAPASVVRAVIMISLYGFGKALARPVNAWNILGAAAIISLVIDPRSLFTAGFALSFSAVAGIIAYYQPMRNAVAATRPGQWLLEWGAGQQLLSLMLLTVAAQLGSLPVALALFHRIPLMGVLANLVIVPLAGLAIFALLAAFVCALILPPLAALFGDAAWGLLSVVELAVDNFAALGTPQIVTGRPADIILLTMVAFLILLPRMAAGGTPRLMGKLALGGLILINLAVWGRTFSSPGLRVTVLDVGQGDAIHIATPAGKHILIDAGPRQEQWDAGRMIVVPYLLSQGITELDLVVVSHAHSDHAGGLSAVMESMNVHKIWHPPTPSENRFYRQTLQEASLRGVSLMTPTAGSSYQVGGVRLDVLAPDSAMISGRLGANEGSLVVKLRYGKSSLLFTGDIEARAEYRLLSYGDALKSDWMKVAHHGGNTSSSARIIKLVAPAGAVISVGARNRYNHPSEGVLSRFANASVPLLATDDLGAIMLYSDGTKWKVTTMIGTP